MHSDTTVLLSRIQFAWVIGWHILLPAFTVGLAAFVAFLEIAHVVTGRRIYLDLSQFWLRIFAISFGMGVVTGIVMPFQFGTNWSRFADDAGNIISPLLAYEGLTAFFLEATFLGVLLFGRKLVPPSDAFVRRSDGRGRHAVLIFLDHRNQLAGCRRRPATRSSTADISLRTGSISSSARPSHIASRHTVSAFYVTTAFVVLGVGAYTLRCARAVAEGRRMMLLALLLLLIFVPLQIFLGDAHGLNTLDYQPAKLAAIEGSGTAAAAFPPRLIRLPDAAQERNLDEIAIPKLGSLYLTHSWDGAVKGLKDFPRDERPPVAIVFSPSASWWASAFLMLAVVHRRPVAARGATGSSAARWYLRLCQVTTCRSASSPSSPAGPRPRLAASRGRFTG